MKTYMRSALAALFLLSSIFFLNQNVLSQETWRERIRETLKERRQNRSEQRRQSSATAGDYDFSLVHDGRKRTYKVHVPPSYNKSIPTPLILAFHGGGGNSAMMANDKYYNWISKSDKEGFIIAFPNGTSQLKSEKFATWNAGNCCGYARDNDIDDVGFVNAIIEEMESKFYINVKKIYATGFSNGAMLCYRLAIELSDKLKAIAAVAGTENFDNGNPKWPISIIHIHAKDDDASLFNGGAGPRFPTHKPVCDFTSVPGTISRWVKRNNCNPDPKRVMEKPGVYCDLYFGGDNGTQIILCVTEEGRHSWPGGQAPEVQKARGKACDPSNAISATDEIWDFFSSIPDAEF